MPRMFGREVHVGCPIVRVRPKGGGQTRHDGSTIQQLMPHAMPHILYVITDLNVGGVPLHLLRLVRAMTSRGYCATVVSLAPLGSVADDLREAGVTVLSCEASGGKDVRVFRRLASIIGGCRPDLIHAMLFHANVAARWAGNASGIGSNRILCEIQTVEVERRWHLWVDRFTHEGCRLTIGNSPSVIEHLAKRAGIPRDRLRLVRGGIDTKRILATPALDRDALGMPSDAALWLWVGRLDPVKGLDKLVRAFARVERDRNPQLLFVGDGPTRSALQDQVEALGLAGCVHFLGVRNDVPALLQTVDGFVFPSRTEGLPNALLEAMAAGLPIITTDVPGCRDLVSHDRTGLLVPYGDTFMLSGALNALLGEPRRAASLGKQAAEEVAARWSIDATFDAYQAIYQEALATSP